MVEGYKSTEVGAIPSDWEIQKMNAICDVRDGTHESPKYYAGGVVFITSKNIVHGKIDFSDVNYISFEDAKNIDKRSKVDKGDILMSMIGTIGNCVLIDFEPSFCIKNVALLKPQKVGGEFLVQLLFSDFYQKYVKNNLDGGIQKFISLGVLRNLDVPLPPTRAEQTAIATTLNDADALIQQLEQLLSKKRNIKTGAMQELLRPKEGWEVKKLGEIGECIIGLTYSPSNVKKDGILVLRSSNIKGNKLAYEDNVFVNAEVSERLKVRKGDVLICVRNGSRNLIGKCAYIDGRAIGETFGAFMSIFRSPFNDYVFYVLQSHYIQRQIEETIGATINQLTNKNLNSFEIPFPNPEEQTRIAGILSDMDHDIQELEKQIAKYKMLKQGMMQSLLTGKIRLV